MRSPATRELRRQERISRHDAVNGPAQHSHSTATKSRYSSILLYPSPSRSPRAHQCTFRVALVPDSFACYGQNARSNGAYGAIGTLRFESPDEQWRGELACAHVPDVGRTATVETGSDAAGMNDCGFQHRRSRQAMQRGPAVPSVMAQRTDRTSSIRRSLFGGSGMGGNSVGTVCSLRSRLRSFGTNSARKLLEW